MNSDNWCKPLRESKVLRTTQYGIWRVLRDKIPTKTNLIYKGVDSPNSLCELCQEEQETTTHMFIGCKVSHSIWVMCDNWVGVQSLHHEHLIQNFHQFHLTDMSEKQNGV